MLATGARSLWKAHFGATPASHQLKPIFFPSRYCPGRVCFWRIFSSESKQSQPWGQALLLPPAARGPSPAQGPCPQPEPRLLPLLPSVLRVRQVRGLSPSPHQHVLPCHPVRFCLDPGLVGGQEIHGSLPHPLHLLSARNSKKRNENPKLVVLSLPAAIVDLAASCLLCRQKRASNKPWFRDFRPGHGHTNPAWGEDERFCQCPEFLPQFVLQRDSMSKWPSSILHTEISARGTP